LNSFAAAVLAVLRLFGAVSDQSEFHIVDRAPLHPSACINSFDSVGKPTPKPNSSLAGGLQSTHAGPETEM
jgi:hypothetical protein